MFGPDARGPYAAARDRRFLRLNAQKHFDQLVPRHGLKVTGGLPPSGGNAERLARVVPPFLLSLCS